MDRVTRLLTVVVILVVIVAGRNARADWRFYEEGGFALDAGFAGGFELSAAPGAQFGAGTYRPGSNQPISKDPVWFEGFILPSLKASFISTNAGEYYGAASAIGAGTRGDGDANLVSSTWGNPTHIAIEEAFVGWRSGGVFSGLGSDAIDVRLGRQNFQVGDAFLIGDGTLNSGARAADSLSPRSAFDGLGVVRFNTDPVRADLFLLRSTTDQTLMNGLDWPRTDFVGTNIEWFESKKDGEGRFAYVDRARFAGVTAMYVYDADSAGCFSTRNCPGGVSQISSSSDRKGLGILSARFGGSMIPDLEDLTLYGEYAYEYNNRTGDKVRANGWYAEPGWTFSNAPWKPHVFYRYSHFSGDGNASDGVKRSFDPLFYTVGRGYGTWFLGEIAAQSFLFNSNQNTHQIGISANPLQDLALYGFFYRNSYDEPGQFGGTSSHALDELDLIASWSITSKINLALAQSFAWAGQGARQYLQGAVSGFPNASTSFNRTWYLTEITLTYAF